MAYSADRGQTWQKYAGNPVLAQITSGNRDPKVLWHEPTGRWIMTLYVEKAGTNFIQFFRSANLKEWTYLSETPGFFECPDFFELPVDGKLTAKKWVLTAANSEYQVGTFDGERFTPETPKLPGHRGKGFYAAQTYNDAPGDRRIQIGWGQMPSPGMPSNQMMCFPCELSLRTTPEGPRLAWQPVAELATIQTRTLRLDPGPLPTRENPMGGFKAELASLEAVIEPGAATVIGFRVRGHLIRYDVAAGELAVSESKVTVPLDRGRLSLRVLVDRTSLEVFAQDGLCYVPLPAIAQPEDRSFAVFAEGGAAQIHKLAAHHLESVWPSRQ